MSSLRRGSRFLGGRRGASQYRLRSGRVALDRLDAREARARPDRFDAHPQPVRHVDGFFERGLITAPCCGQGRSGSQMVPRLKVAPRRRVLRLFEPTHSLGNGADARQRFGGRSDELEAASGASRVLHISLAAGDSRVHLVGARGSVEP